MYGSSGVKALSSLSLLNLSSTKYNKTLITSEPQGPYYCVPYQGHYIGAASQSQKEYTVYGIPVLSSSG